MKVVVKAKNSANKEFTLVEGTDYTVATTLLPTTLPAFPLTVVS